MDCLGQVRIVRIRRISGTKTEYLCFEEALGDGLRPVDEARLPMKIVFDTEVAEDPAQSDRAINVRLA